MSYDIQEDEDDDNDYDFDQKNSNPMGDEYIKISQADAQRLSSSSKPSESDTENDKFDPYGNGRYTIINKSNL